jgi:hypothetical protein
MFYSIYLICTLECQNNPFRNSDVDVISPEIIYETMNSMIIIKNTAAAGKIHNGILLPEEAMNSVLGFPRGDIASTALNISG